MPAAFCPPPVAPLLTSPRSASMHKRRFRRDTNDAESHSVAQAAGGDDPLAVLEGCANLLRFPSSIRWMGGRSRFPAHRVRVGLCGTARPHPSSAFGGPQIQVHQNEVDALRGSTCYQPSVNINCRDPDTNCCAAPGRGAVVAPERLAPLGRLAGRGDGVRTCSGGRTQRGSMPWHRRHESAARARRTSAKLRCVDASMAPGGGTTAASGGTPPIPRAVRGPAQAAPPRVEVEEGERRRLLGHRVAVQPAGYPGPPASRSSGTDRHHEGESRLTGILLCTQFGSRPRRVAVGVRRQRRRSGGRRHDRRSAAATPAGARASRTPPVVGSSVVTDALARRPAAGSRPHATAGAKPGWRRGGGPRALLPPTLRLRRPRNRRAFTAASFRRVAGRVEGGLRLARGRAVRAGPGAGHVERRHGRCRFRAWLAPAVAAWIPLPEPRSLRA